MSDGWYESKEEKRAAWEARAKREKELEVQKAALAKRLQEDLERRAKEQAEKDKRDTK